MNLFNSMKLQPMTSAGAASTVFGTRAGNGPGSAAPVVPDVLSLFSRAGTARGTVNASTDMNYVLGQSGVGLGGFSPGFAGALGALGTGAGLPVVGSLEFSEGDSFNDFFSRSGDGGWNSGLSAEGLDYDGPSSGTISQANTGFAAASAAADADPVIAEGLFETLKQTTQSDIANIDKLNPKGAFGGGRPQSVEAQRVAYMKSLKIDLSNWIALPGQIQSAQQAQAQALAQAQQQSLAQNGNVTTPGAATTPGTYTATTGAQAPINNAAYLAQLNTAAAAQQAEAAQIAQQQLLQTSTGAATAAGASGLPDWLIPAGVGVVALGALAFFLTRGKKK